ncbi:MAG: GTPase [Promethearchaeota archaeon]
MDIHKKLRNYHFEIARRIGPLDGEALIQYYEEIKEDVIRKKYDKFGIFRKFIEQLDAEIAEIQKKPKQKSREYDPFDVKRSGDGRVVLFGISNVGKSTLMNAITNTDVETGNFLHTTRTALAGTCEIEEVKIQIVDVPGFLDFKADWAISKQILRVARTCDAIALVIDLSTDVKKQYDFLMNQLINARLIIEGTPRYKIGIVATKGDLPRSKKNYVILQKITDFAIHPISSTNSISLEKLKNFLFQMMELIRVYTKAPTKKVDYSKPFVVPVGITVEDLAIKIHKDFVAGFKYAKIWGTSVDFDGKRVNLTHELHDKDIIELFSSKKG